MPSQTYLTRSLLLAGLLVLVPSCAPKERIQPLFPRAEDLRVVERPHLDPSSLGSEVALDKFETRKDVWGMMGWQQVARICEWARGLGMKIDCIPKPPDEP